MRQTFIVSTLLLFSYQVFACGIAGSALRTDGSLVDGTAKITTDRNSNVAYPHNGSYSIDLGSDSCGLKVEVYVNGYSVGSVILPSSGYANVDIVLKGSGNVPVR